jgi:hypothetical protein
MINIRTHSNVIKYNVINEILSTHNLSDEDRKYGITFIGSLEFTEDIFYKFISYVNKKSFIGLYAHQYNDFLDNSIKKRDDKVLKSVILDVKDELFFELYNNKLITETDKQQVLRIMSYEYNATRSCIQHAIAKSDIQSNILIGENCLYHQELIKNLKADKGIAIFPGYVGVIHLIDIVEGSKRPKIFTFELWELLNIIINQNLNPQTGKPFSTEVYENIKKKYDLELKLIFRYLKSKK